MKYDSRVTRRSSSRRRRGLRRKLRRAGWKIAIVSVAALVAGGLVITALLQGSASTPPPAAAPQPSAPTEAPTAPLTVAFLGDSYTGGSGMGGVGADGWPGLLSAAEGWPFSRESSLWSAQGGTGYLMAGDATQPLPARAATAVEAQPDVVIVAAGINDVGRFQPEAIRTAASETFSTIRAASPQTRIIAVGPFWPTTRAMSPDLDATRDAIYAAAQDAGVTDWIDPQPWMADIEIGADNVHPTDAGHQVLADRMSAALDGLGVGGA